MKLQDSFTFSNSFSNLVVAPFYRHCFMVFVKRFHDSYFAVYLCIICSIMFVDVLQESGKKCYKI